MSTLSLIVADMQTNHAAFNSAVVGKISSLNSVVVKNAHKNVADGVPAYVGTSLTLLGNASTTGTISAANFTTTSDVHLKTNISSIENALDLVKRLRGVKFDWKSGGTEIGVIAQEVENVIPELVTNGDVKSVKYGNLVAVLIEAVKSLSEQNLSLIERIEKLEAK